MQVVSLPFEVLVDIFETNTSPTVVHSERIQIQLGVATAVWARW